MNQKAFQLAHIFKYYFSTFSDALKAAWKIAKLAAGRTQQRSFVKKSTGEVREAQALALGGLSTIKDGFIRFVEKVSENQTQWRSFRIDHMIV